MHLKYKQNRNCFFVISILSLLSVFAVLLFVNQEHFLVFFPRWSEWINLKKKKTKRILSAYPVIF